MSKLKHVQGHGDALLGDRAMCSAAFSMKVLPLTKARERHQEGVARMWNGTAMTAKRPSAPILGEVGLVLGARNCVPWRSAQPEVTFSSILDRCICPEDWRSPAMQNLADRP